MTMADDVDDPKALELLKRSLKRRINEKLAAVAALEDQLAAVDEKLEILRNVVPGGEE